jgi:hypothetical protein
MEEVTTTISPERYHPLTEQQFIKLRDITNKITSHLSDSDAPFIWDMYNDTRGVAERQPCTCGSSGRYWGEAIAHLRAWLKERE